MNVIRKIPTSYMETHPEDSTLKVISLYIINDFFYTSYTTLQVSGEVNFSTVFINSSKIICMLTDFEM